jgi:hypothetical protein
MKALYSSFFESIFSGLNHGCNQKWRRTPFRRSADACPPLSLPGMYRLEEHESIDKTDLSNI